MSHKIPKPANSKWTDAQWSAITDRGQHILVAAAAGSGKTAVLVERMIQTILDETNPCDVDRLLVVTFTNAAAAEMKQRIRLALEEQLNLHQNSKHLRKQLALIQRASVTTLHSFCLEVIRQHYQLLGIDPSFRIGFDTEIELIRQEIVEEVLEENYAVHEENSHFWTLVDSYGGARSDEEIGRLILRLYDFSRSHPFPEQWLEQTAHSFSLHGNDEPRDLIANPWFRSLLNEVTAVLQGAQMLLEQAEAIASSPEGPAPYLANLEEELAAIKEMLSLALANDWDSLYAHMQPFSFGRLKPCKKGEVDPELQEKAKILRDEAKERVMELREDIFMRSPEQYRLELKQLAPLMDTLINITKQYEQAYTKEKHSRGILDFSDLEHACLRALLHEEAAGERLIPSEVAVQYRERFVEVYVDEYQDTNRVQEAILQLISRSDPGNMFMVGDVKQSIYRFRLAEPELFLEKYKKYGEPDAKTGKKIDLSQNFRSRRAIITAVNDVFRFIMHESAFEIEYDKQAELVYGNTYSHSDMNEEPVQVVLIDRSSDNAPTTITDDHAETENLDTVQLEARAIALQIKQLLGAGDSEPMRVYDKAMQGMRPLTYRDIVILMRATREWAPVMMEEFKAAGIPCYAELNTGYFDAGEIEIVVSLLRVVDNPLQDIPLAAVLRSPIVGLNAEQLAQIRLQHKGSYYEAVEAVLENSAEETCPELQEQLRKFYDQLQQWRTSARRQPLSAFIAQIYRETGYVELVGGMPGGAQRQANLRALYDRAKQYETTSFRGLFQFLRFVDQMKDRGAELGTARALGEQEDVVRLMSIHRSKGLEFPVVFVCGLGKLFNRQDLNQPFLLHRQLGIGPKFVDLEKRISYPSLPYQAIRKKARKEMLAEEMRILYVAMTRAQERMFLIGSSSNLKNQIEKWAVQLEGTGRRLPDSLLLNAQNMLDWLLPVLLKHPDGKAVQTYLQNETPIELDPSTETQGRFKVHIQHQAEPGFTLAAATKEPPAADVMQALTNQKPVLLDANLVGGETLREVEAKLTWKYPYEAAEGYLSKVSVSELKKLHEQEQADESGSHFLPTETDDQYRWKKEFLQRPQFMSEHKMTPVERGMAYHAVMQQLPLDPAINREKLTKYIENMVEKEMITKEQAEVVELDLILGFFESEVGQTMLHSTNVQRELPFSCGFKAKEIYGSDGDDELAADEIILIQGVIDCVFETEAGLVMLDYKTDAAYGNIEKRMKDRYGLQIKLYERAIMEIWQRPVKQSYLFLFDGAHLLAM